MAWIGVIFVDSLILAVERLLPVAYRSSSSSIPALSLWAEIRMWTEHSSTLERLLP